MNKPKHDADVDFIEAMAKLLRDHDLTELEVRREYGEDDALDIRVARQTATAPAPHQPAPAPAASPAPAAAAPASSAAAQEDPALDPDAITSPMVGTAYLSAEPGAAPFINVGDQVKEGQTLLIVEAMKTMNHIPAPRSGTVKRILIEDATPVEFGAPLVVLG